MKFKIKFLTLFFLIFSLIRCQSSLGLQSNQTMKQELLSDEEIPPLPKVLPPRPPIDFDALDYEIKIWDLSSDENLSGDEEKIRKWNRIVGQLQYFYTSWGGPYKRQGYSSVHQNVDNAGLFYAEMNKVKDKNSTRINPIALVAVEKGFSKANDIDSFYEELYNPQVPVGEYFNKTSHIKQTIDKLYGFLPLSRYIENDQVKILFPMGLQKLLSGYSHDIKFLFEYFMKSIKDHNELNKAVIITRFATDVGPNFWHSRMLKKWLDVFPARVKIGPKNSSQMSNPKFMWFPQLDYTCDVPDYENIGRQLNGNKLAEYSYCAYTKGFLNPQEGGLSYECESTFPDEGCQLKVYDSRGEIIIDISDIDGQALEKTPVISRILSYRKGETELHVWESIGVLITAWPHIEAQ